MHSAFLMRIVTQNSHLRFLRTAHFSKWQSSGLHLLILFEQNVSSFIDKINTMKKLEAKSCEEIMNTAYKPLAYCVDGLLTQGLFLLAGAPKVGKSWLAPDICLSLQKVKRVAHFIIRGVVTAIRAF